MAKQFETVGNQTSLEDLNFAASRMIAAMGNSLFVIYRNKNKYF